MGSWDQYIRESFTNPWAFENDSAFQDHLRAHMHTTLRWFSVMGLILSVLGLALLIVLDHRTGTPGILSYPPETVLRIGNLLLATALCIVGILAARVRCSIREGRIFVAITVLAIGLGGLPHDVMVGAIHTERFIALYLAAVLAVPLQAWHTVSLGAMLSLVIAIGARYGPLLLDGSHAPLRVLPPIFQMGAFSGLLTGLTVLSLGYRYEQFCARRTTQRALQTSRTLLHRTEEMAKVGGWELDVETGRMSWTKELYRLHAVPLRFEPNLQSAIGFYAEEAQPVFESALELCIEDGQSFQLELPFTTAQGSRRWVRTRGEAHIEDGKTTRVTGIVHDITDRKQMEQELQEREERLRRAQRIARLGNWERNLETDTLLWSDELRRIFGWPENAEVTYESFLATIHPDDRDVVRETHSSALHGEEAFNIEYRIQRANGEERMVLERGEVHYKKAHPVRVSGTVLDITERKDMERELRQSRMALSEAQKIAQTGHLQLDLGANTVHVSKQCGRLLGLDPDDEHEVSDLIHLVHPQDRERVRHAFARMHSEPVHQLEYRISPNGSDSMRWMRERGRPIKDDAGKTEEIFGVLTDVTKLKRQAHERKERESKIQALYAATGRLLQATGHSEAAALIEELVLNTFEYPMASVHLLDEDELLPVRLSPRMRKVLPERPAYPVDADTTPSRSYRTGETVVVDDVRANDLSFHPGPIRAWAFLPMSDRGLLTIGSPSAAGIDSFDIRLLEVLTGNAAVVLDRIEREQELVHAKEAAEEASELKSAFLANMSHEIRTPLTSIIGFAEVIGDWLSDPPPSDKDDHHIPRFASLIEKSGRRLLETLNSVLDFSQLEAGAMHLEPDVIDVMEAIDETVELFRTRAERKDVELSIEWSDESMTAFADAEAFRRILQNLISNAVKFTEAGDTITVRGRNSGDWVHVDVVDTGIGIDPDFVPHLFNAFEQESSGNQRTHEGSGLGLAVAKRLVTLMNGEIDVHTEKGTGTRFTIRLPPPPPPTPDLQTSPAVDGE